MNSLLNYLQYLKQIPYFLYCLQYLVEAPKAKEKENLEKLATLNVLC